MAESSHTSTAQEGVTPLLLLQPPAWEEVPSNPQLPANKANETSLPQWMRPINEGLQRFVRGLYSTAFQTRAKETFDSFMSESWRYIAANAKTTKERQQTVN